MGSQLDIDRFAHRLRGFINQAVDEALQPVVSPKESETSLQFAELALQLFTLQSEHNPPYGKYCRKLGLTPADIEHWSQIPALPTAAFKEFEITCLPSHDRTTVFHSSGTTEKQPSRHFHSTHSLEVYEASLLPWFRRHVLQEATGMRMVSLTPPGALVPHSSLAHMFEVVMRELGAADSVFAGKLAHEQAWELDIEKLVSELMGSAARGRPVLLLGTAFLFVHLIEHFDKRRLRLTLPSGSRLMETGGYKGRSRSFPRPKLYGMLTERLGIEADSIIGEYGMSELSSQAYDLAFTAEAGKVSRVAPPERVFHFPPWAMAQIVSMETGREVAEGQPGTLRVFDLANAWSVMAVQTEDLAVKRGTGFELVGRAAAAEPRGCSLMSVDSL